MQSDNKHLLNINPNDEDSGYITLVDDEGAEHEFEILDFMDKNGKTYVALEQKFDNAEDLLDDPGQMIVLQVTSEGVEEYLEAIEDEKEFDEVSKEFIERLKDDYDIIE